MTVTVKRRDDESLIYEGNANLIQMVEREAGWYAYVAFDALNANYYHLGTYIVYAK